MRSRFGLWAMVAALALVGAGAAAPNASSAAHGLKLMGDTSAKQTVSLTRRTNGTLGGEINVAVRNGSGATARVRASYLPTGSTSGDAAGTVRVAGSTKVPSQGTTPLELAVSLPRNSSPSNLKGVVELQLSRAGAPVGKPVELQVSGLGDPLAGVSLDPAKVEVHSTNQWGPIAGLGPIANHDSDNATVELRGPGVPDLFRQGVEPVSFDMLLRTTEGGELTASFTELKQTDDPNVAEATLAIRGDFDPGEYAASLPISDLSESSPKLSVDVQANHGFVWALLVVFIGAFIGGGIYFASNLRRRKLLLRECIKNLLRRYKRKLKALDKQRVDGRLPIWDLSDYLKDESTWYKVDWSALPELDGVEATWSSVYFARTNADLDDAATSVTDLRAKVTRWLRAAEAFGALTEVQQLDPVITTGEVWASTKAVRDTRSLLRRLREIEPVDDASAETLLARVRNQARWHAALAHAWNMKGVLGRHMAANPSEYSANDHAAFKAMDLEALDKQGSPEHSRTDDTQFDLESSLDDFEDTIKATYKGKAGDLEPSGPRRAVLLGAMTVADVHAGGVRDLLGDEPADRLTGSEVGSEEHPERMPATIANVIRRDFAWTAIITVVTTAAYVPIFYGPTWGTVGDYASAFAAGFLGKAVVDWTALPLFQSLHPGARQATAAAGAGTQPQGATAVDGVVAQAVASADGSPPKVATSTG
jgi:hypothetical protein